MKFLILLLVFIPSISICQSGWLTNSITNSAYLWNGNNFNVKVGLGLNNPSAQFHTNGSIRFQGLTNSPGLTRVIVSDANGNLFWKTLNPTDGTDGWGLQGNDINDDNYMGSNNNFAVKFKSNNITRLSLETDGRVLVADPVSGPYNSAKRFTVQVNDKINYNPQINAANPLPYMIDGVVIVNTTDKTTPNHGAGLNFISSAGSSAGWGVATINGISVASNKMDLTFQVEDDLIPGSNYIFEAMRIQHDGKIGIGVLRPQKMLHIDCKNSSLKFDNLATGTGNYLVIDNTGNVSRSSKSAFSDDNEEIKSLQTEVAKLKAELETIKNMLLNQSINDEFNRIKKNTLEYKISPNPSSGNIKIEWNITYDFTSAICQVHDLNGNLINSFVIKNKGKDNKFLSFAKEVNGSYVVSFNIDDQIYNETISLIR